ncbi:hypothetical protein FO519_006753 [Halicephalobus sp. NKZ332]|nr:hypothetical protein FO519_006753 [Halicephalobus sp. NKZ332]
MFQLDLLCFSVHSFSFTTAFQEEHQGTLSDGRRITTRFNANDDPSSSGRSSPDPSLKINDGRSLTLEELVGRIEAESGQVVESIIARVRRRRVVMPVAPPQPNVDRFDGHGSQLVEDVAYDLANRQRLSIHGIIELIVTYVNIVEVQDVYYYF